MPRARTPEERERVGDRLLTAGRELFERQGLAKVTIADLARSAGIGKGSFYQFHASKEELFLAIHEHEEERYRAALVAELETAASGREALVTLLGSIASRLRAHPFLRLLLDPQTLLALSVAIPPERFETHRKADEAFFMGLARKWKRRGWLRNDVAPQRFVDVLTALFVMSTQEHLVGEETLTRAAREIAEAVADRWTRTPEP
nr:TetR/AcrR family transcriptional regulator [Myxococcales bacterium]